MMQTPTITADGGRYTFEWGAGLVIEVLKVKRTRWGDDLDVRVLDKAQENSPLLVSATVRLNDLRDRERFCQALERRDGKVDDWEARLQVVADYISRQAPSGGDHVTPVVVRLSDVQREEVEWLSENRIAKGKVHMMDGDPGVGKTFASEAIMAAVTTGAPLFGEGERQQPAQALMLTAEDGLGDTVRPRIEDMAGDLSRVTGLTAVRNEDGEERHLSLVDDLSAVEQVLNEGDYAVLVIDPINAYLGTKLDTNRDAALRSVLTPIAALAAKHGVAIILIRHLTKGSRDKPIYRGQGSIAYTAAARLAMIVGKNPDDEQERVIAWVKNNLGPEAPAIAFSLDEGQFRWLGETDVTAAALVAPEKGTEERSALEEAKGFLRKTLAGGPAATTEVEKQAKGIGITDRTLRRAREALGIKPEAVHEHGKAGAQRWVWALPEGLDGQDGQVGKVGHLTPISYLRPVPQPEMGGHLNTSAAGEQEESSGDGGEEAERDLCFGTAMALDFPEIALGPGRKVTTGEESWRRFSQRMDLAAIRLAQATLDNLGGERDA